jgi:hypothetical protein
MSVSDIIRRAIEIGEQNNCAITFDDMNQLCGNDIPPEDIETILNALSDAGIHLVEER